MHTGLSGAVLCATSLYAKNGHSLGLIAQEACALKTGAKPYLIGVLSSKVDLSSMALVAYFLTFNCRL